MDRKTSQLNLIVMGPQGAGKGTQCVQLADKFGIPHISTGDMMREAVRSGSELGRKVERLINDGKLVPDDIVLEIVKERLQKDDTEKGFILDGFPRNRRQAEALDSLLNDLGRELTAVIVIEVPREESIRRLLKRAEIEGRGDDNEEAIQRRLSIYEEETAPLRDYYAENGRLFLVNGLGSVDEVKARILEILDKEVLGED